MILVEDTGEREITRYGVATPAGRRWFDGEEIESENVRDKTQETFSEWLQRNYLADGAAYGKAGGQCWTRTHPPRA